MSVFSDDEPLDISLLDAPPPAANRASRAADARPAALDYETPPRVKPRTDNMYFWWAIAWLGRKALFAGGLGLFAGGFGEAILRSTSDGPGMMAFGAIMVGLAIPLSPRRK